MERKVKVVGYGTFEGQDYQAVLLEVTKHSIWLRSDGGRHEFRIRDGKRVGDNAWSGFRIDHDDLTKIPGRRKG